MRQFSAATQATYAKMWNAFQNGFINQHEWILFAGVMLDTVLRMNQQMLMRMKHNDLSKIQQPHD